MHYFPPSFLSFLLLSIYIVKGYKARDVSHGITTDLYNLLHKKPLPPLHVRHVGEEKEERRGGWGRGKRKLKEGGDGGEGKQRRVKLENKNKEERKRRKGGGEGRGE